MHPQSCIHVFGSQVVGLEQKAGCELGHIVKKPADTPESARTFVSPFSLAKTNGNV